MMNPEQLQPPSFLKRALPVSAEDIESGAVANLVLSLATMGGFSAMDARQLQHCVALAFGYETWEHLVQRRAEHVAVDADLPRSEYRLVDVMAWRLYLSGMVGLADACTGMSAAWESNALSSRKLFSQFGSRLRKDDDPDDWKIERCVELPHTRWDQWPESSLMPDGSLRLRWRAERAYLAATYCWSEGCGIGKDALAETIEQDACLDLRAAIDQSWMYSSVWPPGLQPVQYLDRSGRLLGYGWHWRELGAFHSSVFRSQLELKESAVALWTRRSTAEFATSRLPKSLLIADFENPWDARDLYGPVDPQIKMEVELELITEGREPPKSTVVATDGQNIALGVNFSLDGECWTRRAFRPSDAILSGLLGLTLRPFKAVSDDGGAIEWLAKKVPYAIDQEAYEYICRLLDAIHHLAKEEKSWLDSNEAASTELGDLLRASSALSTQIVARKLKPYLQQRVARAMRIMDVPQTGEVVAKFHPELVALPEHARGEYALSYYEKNGIRHDHDHMRRDLRFMAYCLLRNMGLDPVAPSVTPHWLGVSRILRVRIGDVPHIWAQPGELEILCQAANCIQDAVEEAEQLLNDLDDSTNVSRFELVSEDRASP